MAETLTLSLRKNDPSEPWGFRLQGGIDFKTPLSVQMVNPGGVAERCGLQPSDAVLSLNGQPTDVMEHDQAKNFFVMASSEVQVVIQRGAVSVWKPKVTPLSELRTGTPQNPNSYGDPADQFIQRTSLAADKPEPIRVGSAHNRSARPFPGFGGASSAQSNSFNAQNSGGGFGGQPAAGPQGGYGGTQGNYGGAAPPQNAYQPQQQYADHSANSANSLNPPPSNQIKGFRSVSPSFLNSPQKTENEDASGGSSLPSGMKSVRAPVFDPSKVAPQLKNHPVCKVCNQQIIGVFVKIMGEPHHAECFKCAACNKNLKNQGYYESEGRLYCDAHGPSAQTAY